MYKKLSPTQAMLEDYIDLSYFEYKVCEGCESIILHSHIFCPRCSSYNFDTSYKRIKKRFCEIMESYDNIE